MSAIITMQQLSGIAAYAGRKGEEGRGRGRKGRKREEGEEGGGMGRRGRKGEEGGGRGRKGVKEQVTLL